MDATTAEIMARLRVEAAERRATERAAVRLAMAQEAAAARRGDPRAYRRLVRRLERECGRLGIEVLG